MSVIYSHDHSVKQFTDITRRNLMLITLRAKRVNTGLFYRKYGRTCVCLIRVRLDAGVFFVIF